MFGRDMHVWGCQGLGLHDHLPVCLASIVSEGGVKDGMEIPSHLLNLKQFLVIFLVILDTNVGSWNRQPRPSKPRHLPYQA